MIRCCFFPPEKQNHSKRKYKGNFVPPPLAPAALHIQRIKRHRDESLDAIDPRHCGRARRNTQKANEHFYFTDGITRLAYFCSPYEN